MTPYRYARFMPSSVFMKDFLFELSKLIQNYANIVSAVVFLGHYWRSKDTVSFLVAIISLVVLYVVSYVVHSLARNYKEVR